jgi:hypothetical protein
MERKKRLLGLLKPGTKCRGLGHVQCQLLLEQWSSNVYIVT